MTDKTAGQMPENDIPEAVVKLRSGISIVWIIPIVAALIGAWVAYKSFSEVGPTIVITFENAEGLDGRQDQGQVQGCRGRPGGIGS